MPLCAYQGPHARRWFRHQADSRYPLRGWHPRDYWYVFGGPRDKCCCIGPTQLTPSAACRTLESAKSLAAGIKHSTPVSLDVNDEKALDAEVAKHDLVISLIPYTFHATVIKSAIRQKKHVVTTSYVNPQMAELDQQCKDAGITVMNEIGLGMHNFYSFPQLIAQLLTVFRPWC